MPEIRNTVTGQRALTAHSRDRRITSTVAKKVASVAVAPAQEVSAS